MFKASMRSAATVFLTATAIGAAKSATAQQTEIAVDVPAQALSAAIAELGRETGLIIGVDASLLAGRESLAVNGIMSPTEALIQMTTGSGLVVEEQGEDGVVLRELPATDGDNGAAFLDPILVQGELQTRTLQDTQTSVAVVTGEELERRSDVELRDVTKRTAGVSTSARGIGFVIRGIDERGVSGNADAGGATVTTSFDGIRISNYGRKSTTFLSTWDLEQIEFLRGPQSTQTGRNALAGAVVVRSKDPTYKQEFKLRGAAGNGGLFEGAFAANLPIVDDMLAVRLTGEVNKTDGFVDNVAFGTDDEAETRDVNLRGAVRFDPTEDLSAILKLGYINATDGFQSSETEFLPRAAVDTDAPSEDRGIYRNLNLRIGYDLSDEIRIESETSFSDREFTFSGDFDGGPDPESVAGDDNPGHFVEQELKVLYESDRIRAVGGVFFADITNKGNRNGVVASSLLSPLFPPFTISFQQPSRSDTRNYAVFGEVEYEVLDGLTLIAGGRYDREEEEFFSTAFGSASNPAFDPLLAAFLPAGDEATSSTFDSFLPKAGVVYDFTDSLSLGFTYQRGYRAGGATLNFATFQQSQVDPEYTNNYEIALRSTWFDDLLTFNANAFFIDWTDQQVIVRGPTFATNSLDINVENAGSSQLYGGEIELSAQPIEGLEVFGSFGYTETEFTDFVSGGDDFTGNEFRNAPKFTGAFGGTYFFENGIFLGADATYTSGSFSDAANSPGSRSDNRFLLNFRAGYETENFSVFAYLDNALDNDYVEEIDAGSVTVGDPLTFGIVGQVNF
ncbi:MAG: TonB-dependent receptor [Pseudomonadota bacterium]